MTDFAYEAPVSCFAPNKQKFTLEQRLIIDTIVENWFDTWDRQMCGNKAVEDLKESLWDNLKYHMGILE